MFMPLGLQAVKLLHNAAEYIGDGSVETYFNRFRFEDSGLFDWVEDIATSPDLRCEEYVFGVLAGIRTALEHDQEVMGFFGGMKCREHTLGLPYPVLVAAILEAADFHSSLPVPLVFHCRYCQDTSNC